MKTKVSIVILNGPLLVASPLPHYFGVLGLPYKIYTEGESETETEFSANSGMLFLAFLKTSEVYVEAN